MSTFLTEDFLLLSDTAKTLYHDYAKKQPIIDYHCHLQPRDVAENRQFKNLTEVWLKGDHYKWRAMRSLGVDEKYITGDGTDYEKFLAWAKCVPMLIGNPLYHWTHLELRRPFGIKDRVLNSQTAESIWNEVNEKLKQPEFSPWGIIKQMDVKVLCTTDDPIDSLEYHSALQEKSHLDFKMYPTFRPDKAGAVEDPYLYRDYIEQLSRVSGVDVVDFTSLSRALESRHNYFHSLGCRISDHAIRIPEYESYTQQDLDATISTLLDGKKVSEKESAQLNTALLQLYGRLNKAKNWTMQLHIGAIRNNNTRMFNKLGPDTGFDSIGGGDIALPLSRLLNSLDIEDQLPKTIIYVLNSADNDIVGTMIGNFQDGSIAGKIQFGSGWWFNDQKTGMEKQMESLANMGVLSQFVGMLTDSRSFLSYTRHEYFRRILCNKIGTWVENGEAPKDLDLLGEIVTNISYNNSLKYFNFPG
ncbi:glucuronate isomerase [Thiospirochaeta perfilievii]|uniref:Uronate isomerase n=1 Tax=Thiospirochaeta perfilievii TaxID=252967 RepID=A0A5C1QB82_9SPIO|nr:glucuronate isomerase [Thiospirochaeta perfilievii]QEN04310.1 glucuronate isomerase [Thiospirochaeta perfilievii]